MLSFGIRRELDGKIQKRADVEWRGENRFEVFRRRLNGTSKFSSNGLFIIYNISPTSPGTKISHVRAPTTSVLGSVTGRRGDVNDPYKL